jgi:hypothetical protein
VLLAATAALAVTGYRGGQNVYEFGVGVKRIAVRFEAPHGDRTSNRCRYCAGICPV